MTQQKWLVLFISLAKSDKDVKEFKAYLGKPQTEREKHVHSFFAYLKKQNGDFNKGRLTPQRVYKKVFGVVAPLEKCISKLRRVESDFSKSIEEFLVQQEINSTTNFRDKLLAKALKKRGLENLSRLSYQAIIKKEPEIKNEDEFQFYEEVYSEMYYLPNAALHSNKSNREFLSTSIDYLEYSYAIKRLQRSCELMVQNYIYGQSLSSNFEERLENFIKGLPKGNSKIEILRSSALFFLNKNERTYIELKETYFQNVDDLAIEKWMVLLFLINGINMIEEFSGERAKETFELYKYAVKEELVIGEGFISPDNFNNIIYLACQCGDFDYARSFIGSHIDCLIKKEDHKENIEKLCDSYEYFSKRKYTEVIECLGHIKYRDFSYGLRKHVLILKSIFEAGGNLKKGLSGKKTNEEFLLPAYSETFKTYLRRKREDGFIGEEVIQKNLNFIELVGMIYHYQYSKFSKNEIQDRVAVIGKNVIEGNWLQEKISRIIK